jgi:uncharacterized protein
MKKVLLILLFFSNALMGQDSPYDLKYEPNRPRSFWLPPLFSAILPGFDQYVEGQSSYGFVYTGTAAVGLGLQYAFNDYNDYPLDTQNDNARMYQLGGEFWKVAMGLSSFHSFKTAANSRKEDFPYLKVEETPSDLALSPINFSYLSRPTTYLGIAGILVADVLIASLMNYDDNGDTSWHVKGTDFLFAGALSAGAGISEEAVFRGWLMPATNYYVDSPWVSNLITAVLFGAAHLGGDNTFPLPQALAGYYFGWVAQRNDWAIGESIFIHTWVDVIAFLAGYASSDDDEKNHTFYLPISFSF